MNYSNPPLIERKREDLLYIYYLALSYISPILYLKYFQQTTTIDFPTEYL